MICFECGQVRVTDSAQSNTGFEFSLPNEEGRDKFDAIFARLGMEQFKPYEKQ